MSRNRVSGGLTGFWRKGSLPETEQTESKDSGLFMSVCPSPGLPWNLGSTWVYFAEQLRG